MKVRSVSKRKARRIKASQNSSVCGSCQCPGFPCFCYRFVGSYGEMVECVGNPSWLDEEDE